MLGLASVAKVGVAKQGEIMDLGVYRLSYNGLTVRLPSHSRIVRFESGVDLGSPFTKYEWNVEWPQGK